MNGSVGFMYFIEIDELFQKHQEPKKTLAPCNLRLTNEVTLLRFGANRRRQTETSSEMTEKFTNLEVFSELVTYHQKGLRKS